MATLTTNISLTKPELADTTKIREDMNSNSDIIDGRFSATYMAVQAKNAVTITGGSITGITDLVVSDGGTGVSTLTDGGVLLGSGTGAITVMAVLTDGQMIVGNGTTDPVAESGATLRTSIDCASRALDNISSCAINTSLLSDTEDTDSLGSTAKEWLNLYIGDAGKIYIGLGQDLNIYRSAANTMTLTASSGVVTSAGLTVGGTLALAANSITMSGSIGVTGTRVTKLWATDIEATNVPTVGGTAMPLKSDKLSVFAATTSAELAGVISNETGSGLLVFATSPTFTTQITTPLVTAAAALALNSASNNDIIIQPNGTGNSIIYAPSDVVTTKTAAATLTIAEAGTVLVSCAATPYTITLPTAVGHTGLRYHFIKTDANYFLITLEGDGAETFNYENSTGSPNLTYLRLNTPCAEVTIVSDGSNWQVINERLGQVPECSVGLGTNQLDSKNDTTFIISLDTEAYDIGSNFDISVWVSGTADGNVLNHLQDDTTSPFTSAMVGYRVKNTTDTTEATITVFNDAGDVTLSADIFPDGTDAYEIKHSEFVCPVSGRYMVLGKVMWTNIVADKIYWVHVGTLGSKITGNNHAATTGYCQSKISTISSYSKDDTIQLLGYHAAGVGTIDIRGIVGYTNIIIRLISKD